MSLKRMLCCFGSSYDEIQIPEDLLIEILLRVPTDMVTKFRRLSKFHRDWIDSPDFIRKHYDLRTSCSHIIVNPDTRSWDWKDAERDYQVVRLDSTKFGAEVENWINSFNENGYSIVDSCVGFLCFLLSPAAGRDGRIFVWNPLTGGRRKIDVHYDNKFISSYLLGYDAATHDLKILKIRRGNRSTNRISQYHCEIYSFRTGSWREIRDSNSRPILNLWRHRIFVEGTSSLHTVDPRGSIITFDFSLEKFSRIGLPKRSGYLYQCSLLELDGCLCIGNYKMPCEACCSPCWSVWGMMEYGVEKSWTWLFCLRDFARSSFPVSLKFVNGGRQLLLTSTESGQYEVRLYDFKHKKLIKRKKKKELKAGGGVNRPPKHFLYSPSLRAI